MRPDRSATSSCTSAVATRRARHRRAARLLRRPGLPAVARSTGPRPGGMAGSTFKPFALAAAHQGRLLAEEHLRRQLAVHVPRRPRGAQRGRRRRHQLRLGHVGLLTATGGVDQHRVRRHVRRACRTGRRRSSPWPTRWGSRRPRPTRSYPGIPNTPRDLEPDAADHAGQGADQRRSTWPTPTPRSPTAASAPTCT